MPWNVREGKSTPFPPFELPPLPPARVRARVLHLLSPLKGGESKCNPQKPQRGFYTPVEQRVWWVEGVLEQLPLRVIGFLTVLGAAAAHATPRLRRGHPPPAARPPSALEGLRAGSGDPSGVAWGCGTVGWEGRKSARLRRGSWGLGRSVVGSFWELARGFVFCAEVCNNGYMPSKAPDKRTMKTQQRA